MVINEHLPVSKWISFPALESRSESSHSELESSSVLDLREEPRIEAPATSDPIPDATEPIPITDVAAMDWQAENSPVVSPP